MKTFISALLVKLFIRKSRVLKNLKLGEKFSLLTIALPKKRVWSPGDKVQIKISSSAMRSYTPVSFIDERTFTTLIFLPKKGPGTLWANKVRENEKVEIIGPRPSLNLEYDKKYFFFGDETSIGLYVALKTQFDIVDYLFEVQSLKDTSDVIEYYQLEPSHFIESHLNDSKQHLANLLLIHSEKTIILSGNKISINSIATLLNQNGITQIIQRPYWGKR